MCIILDNLNYTSKKKDYTYAVCYNFELEIILNQLKK
jgi:hypothetical protein